MIGDIVYLNGRFVEKDDAKVSVFDHGFIYGDGAFEGLQIVNGRVFLLKEHLKRLYDSVRYLGFEIPMAPDAFRDVICETARRNGLENGYVRPIVTRGTGPLGIRNMAQLGAPTVVVMAQHESIESRREKWNRGITAQVVSVRRMAPAAFDSRAKTCNYINNILAYLEAQAAGAETALMLDAEGYVAEAYSSNVFVVKDGTVATPALGHILGGITRATLLGLCRAEGIPAVEGRLTTYDLLTADEVFECGTMAEVRPLVRINGRTIGPGTPGPMARRLHRCLREMMESGQHGEPIATA
ncbi:branched-chain-amino-acid transaminase [Stella sp.]|jgi:branched-chain amino acid aminotransferase|uniref:branched-chain-amino-acid transaminase n=1 Tax=Stella sp. TaxID=2912054 RepID=UPI0035AFFE5A